MRAPLSGKSRNFGFCRFASEQERDRALVQMNGNLQICGKPVRVSLATAKKTVSGLAGFNQAGAAGKSCSKPPLPKTIALCSKTNVSKRH